MTPGNLDASVPPAKVREFSPYVAERLRWYVYALRDPRDQRVFYVGKGCGNRVFQHARAALAVAEGSEPVSTKIAQILDIIAAGLLVDAVILRHGIPSEKAAYDVEAAIIDILRLLDPALANDRFQLTNLVLGHQHATKGLVNADVVATLYDAPTAPPILAPSILFRIPALWTPQMSSEELYEATRGWWVIGPNPRANAKYAFAVSKGVVRGIYRVTEWRERREGDRDWAQDLGKKPRWGFAGGPATEMGAWLNTSVAHLFKKGEANPVKAVNLFPHPESETSQDTIAFTVSEDGIVLELIRIGAAGLFVRRSGHWREIDPSADDPRIEGREWIDVTEDGIAFWDRADCSETPISRADALTFATDPLVLSAGSTEVPVVGLAPGLENESPTGHRSRKLAESAAKSDPASTTSVPTVERSRKVGSLHGVDPWDGGLTWTRYVPLLWALRPSLDDAAGWLPPDPRNPDGQAEEGAHAWWTPLLHLVRFQMGLRSPGEHLAWLRSDPEAAAAHSPLVGAQFALMDKWWGSEAVDDFIAWAVNPVESPHLHRWPESEEWPTDEAVPRLSERQTAFYERRRESARWKSTWGGGYDPMHLDHHAQVPFTTSPDVEWKPGLNWPNRNPLLRWLRPEHSAGLRLVAADYSGWYGELLARGWTLREQVLVQVTIEDFGPLGTFAIGGGRQPRMFAYPDAPHHDASVGGPGKLTFALPETSVEPVVGDVGVVAMLSPVVDGEIRIWTEEGHARWRVREPEELAAAMGKGAVARTGVEPNRFREVGMLMKSGTLLLPARMKRGQKPIEARSFGLSRAPKRTDSQGQWDEFARWLGTAALSAAGRGEFLVVENGGWDHQPHPYALFMCMKRDEIWVSHLEVSPAPKRSTLLWPSPPADPAGATATAPATERIVAVTGNALASAISEWARSPLDLAVTYGPSPDGPAILTPTGSVAPT